MQCRKTSSAALAPKRPTTGTAAQSVPGGAVRVAGGVELEYLLLADRTMTGHPGIQQQVYAMLRAQALSPEDTLGLSDPLLGER